MENTSLNQCHIGRPINFNGLHSCGGGNHGSRLWSKSSSAGSGLWDTWTRLCTDSQSQSWYFSTNQRCHLQSVKPSTPLAFCAMNWILSSSTPIQSSSSIRHSGLLPVKCKSAKQRYFILLLSLYTHSYLSHIEDIYLA